MFNTTSRLLSAAALTLVLVGCSSTNEPKKETPVNSDPTPIPNPTDPTPTTHQTPTRIAVLMNVRKDATKPYQNECASIFTGIDENGVVGKKEVSAFKSYINDIDYFANQLPFMSSMRSSVGFTDKIALLNSKEHYEKDYVSTGLLYGYAVTPEDAGTVVGYPFFIRSAGSDSNGNIVVIGSDSESSITIESKDGSRTFDVKAELTKTSGLENLKTLRTTNMCQSGNVTSFITYATDWVKDYVILHNEGDGLPTILNSSNYYTGTGGRPDSVNVNGVVKSGEDFYVFGKVVKPTDPYAGEFWQTYGVVYKVSKGEVTKFAENRFSIYSEIITVVSNEKFGVRAYGCIKDRKAYESGKPFNECYQTFEYDPATDKVTRVYEGVSVISASVDENGNVFLIAEEPYMKDGKIATPMSEKLTFWTFDSMRPVLFKNGVRVDNFFADLPAEASARPLAVTCVKAE